MSFHKDISYVRLSQFFPSSCLILPLSVLCPGATENLQNSVGSGCQEVANVKPSPWCPQGRLIPPMSQILLQQAKDQAGIWIFFPYYL